MSRMDEVDAILLAKNVLSKVLIGDYGREYVNPVALLYCADSIKSVAAAYERVAEIINRFTDFSWPVTKMTRDYRRIVRWDERNRRRRLKGLPEKPCPYPRIWKT